MRQDGGVDDDLIDSEPGWFGRMFGGPWHVLVFPLGDDDLRYTEYNGVDLHTWSDDEGGQFIDMTALTAIEAAEAEASLAKRQPRGFEQEVLATFSVVPAPPDFQGGEIGVEVRFLPPSTRSAILRISPAYEVVDRISGFDFTEGTMQQG